MNKLIFDIEWHWLNWAGSGGNISIKSLQSAQWKKFKNTRNIVLMLGDGEKSIAFLIVCL